MSVYKIQTLGIHLSTSTSFHIRMTVNTFYLQVYISLGNALCSNSDLHNNIINERENNSYNSNIADGKNTWDDIDI